MKGIALACLILFIPSSLALAAAPPPPPLKVTLPFDGAAALAVLDARPDVLNGERKDTFVGFTRSLYGIPYPAHTKSKKPLAQDLADLVTRALKSGGSPVQSIIVSAFEGREGAMKALKASGAERLILIEIRDWWSDTLVRTDLHYDLSLIVFNAEGQELGSSSLLGHDGLGKKQRAERRDVPTATNDIFSTLFAKEAVVAAFSADAAPVARSAGCTVEQILKMKEAGLSQQQIEAACGSGS